jgi:hypothetical protein
VTTPVPTVFLTLRVGLVDLARLQDVVLRSGLTAALIVIHPGVPHTRSRRLTNASGSCRGDVLAQLELVFVIVVASGAQCGHASAMRTHVLGHGTRDLAVAGSSRIATRAKGQDACFGARSGVCRGYRPADVVVESREERHAADEDDDGDFGSPRWSASEPFQLLGSWCAARSKRQELTQ